MPTRQCGPTLAHVRDGGERIFGAGALPTFWMVPSDDLVGDGVEVISHILGPGGGIENVAVDALDEPGFPPDRLGTDGVPGNAAMRELTGLDLKQIVREGK